MNIVERVYDWVRNREWVAVLAFISAVIVELESALHIVSGELQAAGDDFTYKGVAIAVFAYLQRRGVWSNASVESRVDVDDVV